VNPTPGWYRDERGELRWWDGYQWTAHTSPQHPQGPEARPPGPSSYPGPWGSAGPGPVPGAGMPPYARDQAMAASAAALGQFPPPRRRNTGLRVVLSLLTVVLLGGISIGAALAYRGLSGPDLWATVSEDGFFQYTVDQHVDSTEELTVPARGMSSKHFALYSDAALSHKVPVHAVKQGSTLKIVPSGASVEAACGGDHEGWTCDDAIQQISAEGEHWGLGATYWLVRSHDEDGTQLRTPVVTKVLVDRAGGLATPSFMISHDSEGTATIAWAPVSGATEYRIVMSEANPTTEHHTVVASTRESTWKAAYNEVGDGHVQNAELRFNTSYVEDAAPSTTPDSASVYQLCVVATDGTAFSGCKLTDAASSLGDLPYRSALNTQRKMWDEVVARDGAITFKNIPTRVYYTALDGSLRSVPATVKAEEISADGTRLPVRGIGTKLGYWIDGSGFTAKTAELFNRKSALDGGNVGNADTDSSVADEEPEGGETKDVTTPYPVFGSSELVRFLARHMINHTEVVDVSDFLDDPGAPDLDDALQEAVTQNPYTMWVERSRTRNGKVSFVYTYSAKEQAALQAKISAKVDKVVKSQIKSGMSDAQKVTVLNKWLRTHATYDTIR
jgi:hypothetical protein